MPKPLKLNFIDGTLEESGVNDIIDIGALTAVLPATEAFVIDGASNPRAITLGATRHEHRAGMAGTRAQQINLYPAGYDDTSSHIVYINLEGSSSNIHAHGPHVTADIEGATSAEIDYFKASYTGEKGAGITLHALHVEPGIAPVMQHTGVLGVADTAFIYDGTYTDISSDLSSDLSNVQLFVSDGDILYVGHTTTFNMIDCRFSTFASSPGIKPTFTYWNGSAWTAIGVSDGSNGMRVNGALHFTAPGDWSTTTVNAVSKYWFRITRTANNLSTPPTEEKFLILGTVNYGWDENADVTVNTVNGNTITTGTGVLTLGAGKTLTASNTITLTATDGSTLAIGAGGILGSAAYTASGDYATAVHTHTGTYQPLATVLSNTTASFTTAQESKLSGIADNANNYTHPNHTGDVTSTGDGAQVIANNAVTYAKMQNVSTTDKLLGRQTAGAGTVEEISCTAYARTLLDDTTASAARATLGAEAYNTNLAGIDQALSTAASPTWSGLDVRDSTNHPLTEGNANVFIATTDAQAIDKGGTLALGGVATGTSTVPFVYLHGKKETGTDADEAGYFIIGIRTSGAVTERFRISSDGSVTCDGRDIGQDGSTLDNLATTIGLSALTSGEVNQLKAIDTTTISAAQWGYVGGADQPLKTTDSPTLGGLTIDVGTAQYTFGIDVHADASLYNSLSMNNVHTDAGRIGLAGGGYGGGAVDDNLYVDAKKHVNIRNAGTIIASFKSDGRFRVGADAAANAACDINLASNVLALRVDRPSSTASDVIADFVSDVTATNTTKCVIRADGDLENVNGSYGSYSDVKLKTNIHDATPKLDKLLKVIIRGYALKENPTVKHIGVIAQELEQLFPGLIKESPDYETLPDPDWVPKPAQYVESQIVDTTVREVEYTEVEQENGRWVRRIKSKTVKTRTPRTETVPVFEIDAEGNETETTGEVPVMEQVLVQPAQTEADRPTITRPTGTVTKAVKYSIFTPILIKSLQELSIQIAQMKRTFDRRISKLEENAEFSSR